jgi:hypothetical protein
LPGSKPGARITPEQALDVVYALMSPELHWLLTSERG